ncbi:MAG TPA: hypothetical protein VNJ47_03775 [Nevskiales bacterium]|nr:hypothetical protein [Nevskiales bacterium]
MSTLLPLRLPQFLRPSLGKVGLVGIGLCLALGLYVPAPVGPGDSAGTPAAQPQLTAQAQIGSPAQP